MIAFSEGELGSEEVGVLARGGLSGDGDRSCLLEEGGAHMGKHSSV